MAGVVHSQKVLLALTQDKGSVGEVLKSSGVTRERVLSSLKEVRGSARVTSQDAESTYQALEKYGRDLTEAARAGGHEADRRRRLGDGGPASSPSGGLLLPGPSDEGGRESTSMESPNRSEGGSGGGGELSMMSLMDSRRGREKTADGGGAGVVAAAAASRGVEASEKRGVAWNCCGPPARALGVTLCAAGLLGARKRRGVGVYRVGSLAFGWRGMRSRETAAQGQPTEGGAIGPRGHW